MKHKRRRLAEKTGNWFWLVFLFLWIVFSCSSSDGTKEITDLRCEYLSNPPGIDVLSPRLSWKMKSAERGARQTAYRILSATNEDLLQNETPDLWDSGKTESSQSIQVEYQGKPLKSGMNVFWKVRVWDEKGKALKWSQTAQWEMGLLKKEDWKSKWISTPELLSKKEWKLPSPLFRKKIQVQKKIKKAWAYISGLGYYELYVNGKKVGDHVLSPNQTNYDRRDLQKWSEPRVGNMTTTVLYETYDITLNLQQGENALGVILGNGWYIQADRPMENGLWYDTPRLLAQFEIEYADGSKQMVTTDERWRTSLSPIVYNGLHSGEIYDARKEQPGWNTAGFDDANWGNAAVVRPPGGVLKAQMSPPDRVTGTIKPVSVTETEKGIYKFDLGQMISGWARLKLAGPKGTKVKLRFIEELGPTYGQTDTYILKGEGTEVWEPRFTWHAFRYVEVSGFPGKLLVDNLEGRAVNTDVKRAGSFECSDTLLNRILKNYRSTQLGNMHGGIPSDCPHRERRGYTGDGQISAKAAIYNFNMAPFYTKWLNDISDAQNHKTGYVPNTAPYQDGGGGTAWGAAYIIIPWYMYEYYSDVRILQQHYEGMKHWIEYMKNALDKNGILVNQGLGEWVPPEAVEIPPDFVNTCYYFYCCRLMEKVADVLQKENDSKNYLQLATNARYVINSTWFNSENSTYSIGRQGANVFPLEFGITAENKADAVFKNLVENVIKNKVHFDTGILATPLLLNVLTQNGRADLAYTLMTQRDFPSFGYMIENGATTLWETWLGDASHSHPMFGSVCQWLYQSLGGISPDDAFPGFKHSVIWPHPVKNLKFANTTYPSLYGDVQLNWSWENDDYMLNVTVPPNTSATVYVTAESQEKVFEGDKAISKNPFVQFVKMEGQNAVFEVQSGKFCFVSKEAKKLMKAPILPTPVISPGDTLASAGDSVKVNITSGVEGTHTYYTLDGSEPDSSSTLFTHPFYMNKPAEIKAKSFKEGDITSFTKTNSVDFMNPNVNGLTWHYYEGVWTELPDFSKLKSIKTGIVYVFGLDKINPQKDAFALRFTGKLKVENAGEYTFYIHSNDGSCLYIDNQLVVNHNGLHGADLEKTGKIRLETGLHPIQLDYFQAGGGLFLRVEYSGPGLKKQDVPAKILFQK